MQRRRRHFMMGTFGGSQGVPPVTFTVTTTGVNQILTIQSLGVSASSVVDWGDGQSNTYTGTATRTHTYASAGTYTVTIPQPLLVTTFDIRDSKATVHSANIKWMKNLTTVVLQTLKADSSFNTADVTGWNLTSFQLLSQPSGFSGTFNSADIRHWALTDFRLSTMLAPFTGLINSADMLNWNPPSIRFFDLPIGVTVIFNSADIAHWRPTTFRVHTLPGASGSFDTADLAPWNLATFQHFNMPASGYSIDFAIGDFNNWLALIDFQMQGNGFSQATVDLLLRALYVAALLRTALNGTINVSGSNATPSGTLAAPGNCADLDTWTGKNFANELRLDNCATGLHKYTTVTIT